MKIEIPATLTAELETEHVSDTYPYHARYSIVLKFGVVEVARWEWQVDRPIDARTDPDEYDVDEFVAAKLREVLTSSE